MAADQQQQLPVDFRCPISLEIMTDPVILPSGHTFDRSSIQRWLDSGHRTCPITKLPLPHPPSLIPNLALRSLITNSSSSSSSSSGPITKLPLTHPVGPTSQTLIQSLTSPHSSVSAKLDSLSQLGRILKSESDSSAVVSAVLRCVDSEDLGLQEKALSVLLNLSLDDDNKVGLVAEGAIGRVLGALIHGSRRSQALAATMLTSLAVVEVNRATIGAYPGAIRSLVIVMRNGRGRERKEAATALYAVCSFHENWRRAVEEGAVGAAMGVVRDGVERGVEVLRVLGKCREGRDEMVRIGEGLVRVLVGVLRNGSCRGVQCVLMVLNCLCSCSEKMRVESRREGVVGLCESLVDDDDEKIRKNASSLIQVLRRE